MVTRAARRGWPARVGLSLIASVLLFTFAGPLFVPHGPNQQFEDRAYAPPTRIHVLDAGRWRAPFMHPLVLEDRVSRRYREDRSVVLPLRWFGDGRFVSSGDAAQPVLLLGADALGRDVLSRAVFGARLSLGVAILGVIGALTVGAVLGGLAGALGGRVDRGLMLLADFLVAVPGAYLVLVLRGILPHVLETRQVFALMAVLFAVAGWPHAARGVRAIIASERTKDYAEAARAAGAGSWRLARQLLPAARGFLMTEAILLVPALLVAEATISYLGLGFAEREASWGTMMQDASNGAVLAEAPWMLAPAAGVFVVVLAIQLIGLGRNPGTMPFLRSAQPS